VFRKAFEKFMDYSIYFSFDRSGYLRHKKYFLPLVTESLPNAVGIVTGGTSGIGLEVVKFLNCNGAKVYSSSRTADPNQSTEKKVMTSLDMSSFEMVKNFCEELNEELDFIVLNAGGMPEDLILNQQNIELQYASQVVGHYLMFRFLYEQKKLKNNCRVIWTASGGMYLSKFDEKFIYGEKTPYDKVATYANAKRAQVILNRMLSKKHGVFQAVMHPGWVNTPGVRTAIPGFFDFTKNRLRKPTEGADTINWLISTKEKLSSGELWFDRKIRNKVIFPWTKNSSSECNKVLDLCESTYEELTKG
jgi:dehydrogenase/reductase SDR family member 12